MRHTQCRAPWGMMDRQLEESGCGRIDTDCPKPGWLAFFEGSLRSTEDGNRLKNIFNVPKSGVLLPFMALNPLAKVRVFNCFSSSGGGLNSVMSDNLLRAR